jgi:uncharacterized membrane protein
MNNLQQQVEQLSQKLEELRWSNAAITEEIRRLRNQLLQVQAQIAAVDKETIITAAPATAIPVARPVPKPAAPVNRPLTDRRLQPPTEITRSLENFIGTNLISKIGILITIIGIFIGAKYAIDKELISAGMRIILGYVCAAALAGIGLRLKPKYLYFSSILLGGGIAVTYFITYLAYSFYHFYTVPVAFIIMLLTTVAAVALSLWVNQKIIALLGQLAAYGIPLLLSDGSGRVAVLFTYISIINAGLIILSFKRDWKLLYRTAFGITWALYASWILLGNGTQLSYQWALVFISIAFVTFYLTFLSYKVLRRELYNVTEISLLLLNALLFYLLGYYIIDGAFEGTNALTFFTIANAAIHIAAGYSIYKAKLADPTVNQVILGLGLLFITVAIPVKLNGSWVTLLWSIEAAILVYIAAANGRRLYLEIALPVVLLAAGSLVQDWGQAYPVYETFGATAVITRTPFLNNTFIISLITCGSFSYIAYRAPVALRPVKKGPDPLQQFYGTLIQLLWIGLLYLTFYNEIHLMFDQIIASAGGQAAAFNLLRILVLTIYSLLFTAGGLFINTVFIKRINIAFLFTAACFFALAAMLTGGLFVIGEMRSLYLHNHSPYWLIGMRYAGIMAVIVTWVALAYSRKQFSVLKSWDAVFSTAFNISLLTLLCNEYVHWLDLAGYHNQYKLGISIICGTYALVLLFIGLIRQKKHLRIGAISLFGITLFKLFAYDLASLNTISKTVVMILLGVLLLIASFLYNKYKDQLLGDK